VRGQYRSRVRAGLAFGAGLFVALSATASALAAGPTSAPAFSKTTTASRINLVSGADVQVDSRSVTVTADRTTNLRDGEVVNVSWRGAHPTGGIIYDSNSPAASNMEYPVAILQCRGVDSAAVPQSEQLRPETCFTQTPDVRYQYPSAGLFPPYRVDRYATAAERKLAVGRPAGATNCPGPYSTDAERWVHFIGVDGTDYPGGYAGCGGLAPEQSAQINALAPPNTTFASTDPQGNGNARFIVQSSESNASLGCDSTHPCSIVVIPVEGISCDAAATGLPSVDVPADVAAVASVCQRTGHYPPQAPGSVSGVGQGDQTVTGRLWWSASNWRNRVAIPVEWGQSASVCSIVDGRASEDIYGSQYLSQMTQQWQPKFCQDSTLFKLQHVQLGEVQAKNLLETSAGQSYTGVKAAFEAGPPQPVFSHPVVQAPTAITGFSIAYLMDDKNQHEYRNLKLTPRLLAKLLSMSYPDTVSLRAQWAKTAKYAALAANPLTILNDPEFLALNPGMADSRPLHTDAAATLYVMSSDSDVMMALTSYINVDPDARAWLDGKSDPWGMLVNPAYKGIALPVTSWPLLDRTVLSPPPTNCLYYSPVPYLPLVAAPVADPAQITQNVLYGITNSLVDCPDPPSNSPDLYKFMPLGRQPAGYRFLMGLVALGDTARYQLNSAALLSQKTGTVDDTMTDLSGRSFIGPTPDSLLSAAKLMVPDDSVGTWRMPYDRLRAHPDAYPGTLLISTAVPTKGLASDDAQKYAKFLHYAAGPGQTAGATPGTLPAGYEPMTAANGLGSMVAYTTKAADSVAAQSGEVPYVSGKVTPTSQPPSPSTLVPSSSGSIQPTSHDASSANSNIAAGSSQRTTTAPSVAGKPTVQPSSTHAISMASTISQPAGPAALILPGLVALAVISGAASVWFSGAGRR